MEYKKESLQIGLDKIDKEFDKKEEELCKLRADGMFPAPFPLWEERRDAKLEYVKSWQSSEIKKVKDWQKSETDKVMKNKKYSEDVLVACEEYEQEIHRARCTPWWDFWSLNRVIANKPQILKDYKQSN
jgi:hypothetical protein